MKHETILAPNILIPQCDLTKWAVVACDQFNADHGYWRKLAEEIGDSPSALNIVFPEIYLDGNREERINAINKTMAKYLADGLFVEREGFVLIERTLGQKKRIGLLAAVNLDRYDWRRVRAEIRATEDTIEDRLPIRVEIRNGASIESPHILIVVDDKSKSIVQPLYGRRDNYEILYDFELNMGGGHLKGYLVDQAETAGVKAAFDALLNPQLQKEKYGFDAGVLLAVGDGNHSLASAKVHWENLKRTLTPEEAENHPARYALVEIVNLHGDDIDFEPIHRLVYGADRAKLLACLTEKLQKSGTFLRIEEGVYRLQSENAASVEIRDIEVAVTEMRKELNVSVEYVHGLKHLAESVQDTDGIGIIMPDFPKEELFGYMLNVGNLPKKAFSIGSAEFKKYYMECRKIVK